MTKPNGYILYEGPSLIDHKPIVMIALLGSKNIKTGNMMQTYIIRSDIDPRLANKTGEDKSLIGSPLFKVIVGIIINYSGLVSITVIGFNS